VATSGGDPDAQRERAEAQGRNNRGKFVRSLDTAKRNAEACDLKAKGWSYRKIAEHFGIDVHTAYNAVQNTLKETLQEPAENLRTLMLERLDAELVRLNDLEEAARTVLERNHYTVAPSGQIVYHGGEALTDDGPVLAAIDRLLKIDEQRRKNDESRRKLLGLDQPAKVEHSGGVKYEIVGVDPRDLK
jgi:DNA-binding CsgD family transcriptional regulator